MSASIGLVHNPPPEPRLRAHARVRHPIRVVTRAEHPLAAQPGPLRLRDLAPYRLGLMHPA